MNTDERIGWLTMGIGTFFMLLPYIIPTIFVGGMTEIFIILIIALFIFLIGASKALPEILFATFGHLTTKPKDRTSKLPITKGDKR